jgi:hypothetical protein
LLTVVLTTSIARREHQRLREGSIEAKQLFAMVFAVKRAIQAAHSLAGRDPEQAWFWTPEWQVGEREAVADIAAGRTTVLHSEEQFFEALDSVSINGEAATGPRVLVVPTFATTDHFMRDYARLSHPERESFRDARKHFRRRSEE